MNNNLNETVIFFKALGDPTRLKILGIILSYKNLCVNMIANKLDVTQPAVSQHLKILKNAKILKSQKIGFHVHYQVDFDYIKSYGLNLEKIINNNIKDCELQNKCKKSPDANLL